MGLSAGTRLGPYEVGPPLGAGGMGEVYKARDTRLDRTVAIKVLPSHLSGDPDLKQRFEREAKAISSFNHAHICTLYDIGSQEGVDFLVMEYLEGETLAERLKRGPLSVSDVVKIGSDLADALERAHRQGIIHRDLKPGNIMLTNSGAKLMDFGLAKPVAIAAAATNGSAPFLSAAMTTTSPNPQSPLTSAGMLVGTVQYMSPEQLQGIEADARSDIFAFGAVLYEMLTGRRAFQAKSQLSVATAILEKDPEPISTLNANVPHGIAQVVSICLAKNPDERFACAHDLKLQLKSAPTDGNERRTVNRTREMLLSAAFIAVLLAAGWLSYEKWQSANKPRQVLQSELDLYTSDVADRSSGGHISAEFALSPDGKFLAYVARKSGSSGTQLWLRHLDSGTSTPLPATEEARSPFWSPDSRGLGFFALGKLKTIVLSTQTVTDLCPAHFYWGTWGSRGTIVIVGGPELALQRIPATGGTPSTIPSTASGFRPTFLPDGHHVAYLQFQSGDVRGYSIKVAEIEDGHPADLGVSTTWAALYTSGYLIYSTTGRIVAQRFDTSNLRLTSDPATVVDFESVSDLQTFPFTASENGLFVYRSSSERGSSDVRLFSRDGKSIPSSMPIGFNNNPVFSPDASKVAYDMTSGLTRDVWLYDLKRKSNSRLTMGQGLFSDPVWSPDGKKIAMAVEDQSKFRVVIIDIDGGSTDTIYETAFSSVWVRSWSSDGRVLFVDYYTRAGKRSVGVLSLADRKITESNPGKVTDSQRSISVSPDGHWIAYVSDESGHEEVYLQAYPGPGKRALVSDGGGIVPRWRGDGHELYYISGNSMVTAVAVNYPGNSIELGPRQELFPVSPLYPNGNPFDVSRDGKLFVVESVSQEKAAPARMIFNWQELVQK